MTGGADTKVDAVSVGSVLAGKYRVDRILGEGGMGVVVAATHLQLEEPVAMKFLHAAVAKQPDLVARFQREAKAARKIKSEHVVKILDVGTLENGAPFMVMEYLAGTDLDRLVKNAGPQSVPNTVDYVLQACEALAEAHVQGMVHRDLKPANLFLAKRADQSALVKVLDFGISKVTGNDGAELGVTKTNSAVLGSPLYMAPEQMRSLRGVDARTDISSLGVILYELLAGLPPFYATTLTELCATILQDPAPSVRAKRSDVAPGLDAAIHRCLEKDPSRRYPDVAALAIDLMPFASPVGRGAAERVIGVYRAAGVDRSTPPLPSNGPSPMAHTAPHHPSGPPAPMPAVEPMRIGSATTGKAWAGPGPGSSQRVSTPVPAASNNNGLIVGLAAAVAVLAAIVVIAVVVPKVRASSKPAAPISPSRRGRSRPRAAASHLSGTSAMAA